jgi:hypothetical protein
MHLTLNSARLQEFSAADTAAKFRGYNNTQEENHNTKTKLTRTEMKAFI